MLPHGLFAKASPSPLAPSSREREQSPAVVGKQVGVGWVGEGAKPAWLLEA